MKMKMTSSALMALFLIMFLSISLIVSERQARFNNMISMYNLLDKYNASIATYDNFIKVKIPSFNTQRNIDQPKDSANLDTTQMYLALNQTKIIFQKMQNYTGKVKLQMNSIYNESQVLKKEYELANKNRVDQGFDQISKILFNLHDPKTVMIGIKKLYNTLKKLSDKEEASKNSKSNKTLISFLQKKTSAKIFPKRLWSSYRKDEDIESDIFAQEDLRGETVTKACISSFLTAIQAPTCWRDYWSSLPILNLGVLTDTGREQNFQIDRDIRFFPGATVGLCRTGYHPNDFLCVKDCPYGQYSQYDFICTPKVNNTSQFTITEVYVRD